MAADNNYRIGAAASESPGTVETQLSGVIPRSTFIRYPTVHVTGDGQEVGNGYPQAEWVFDYLTRAMLTTLLSFIIGRQSYTIRIRTRDDLGVFTTYRGIMHRPKAGESMTPAPYGARDVTIRFTRLEAV